MNIIYNLNNLKQFLSIAKKNKIHNINIRTSKMQILINKNKKIQKIHNSNDKDYKQDIDYKAKNIEISNNNNLINNSSIIKEDSNIYSTIISPMVGTFYRSPAPNEPVFIEKHDIVEKKQIVCIIEAMKLMNEIESEVNGEIIDILVNDGDIVDCGQSLMTVKTT